MDVPNSPGYNKNPTSKKYLTKNNICKATRKNGRCWVIMFSG